MVNEPRAIDPAGKPERREAKANRKVRQDSDRSFGTCWSNAIPQTAMAQAFLGALRRRAGAQ
jgi:hypothetical protein